MWTPKIAETGRSVNWKKGLILACAVFIGLVCPANPAEGAESIPTKGDRYWQLGTGFYFAGCIGRFTELDAARADWLFLRFPGLPSTKETTELLNRLIAMNPKLKLMIRVHPPHAFSPGKGPFTQNTPWGRGGRMMYDYFYAPGAKEQILAETRRQIRVVLDHIDNPENVVGMTLMEEMPQVLTDMAVLYLKDGETNWAIEAYRKEIEDEYGKPFVWNDEARRWWCKKYVQVFDEIHQVMKEAGGGRLIFYYQQGGYKNLDHVPPGTASTTSGLIPINLADVVKPGRCDGVFAYPNSDENWESDALRFARERDWLFFSQLSHPTFMRTEAWEPTVNRIKTRVPQNLGYFWFCGGSCERLPNGQIGTNIDPSIPPDERGTSFFGPYFVEHTRRFFAQQKVGMDVVEKYLVPELAFDYTIDAVRVEQSTRIFLQIHNTKDNSWYVDPQQAILRDVAVQLLLPAGIELAVAAEPAKVSLGDIEADGYRVVSWPVRIEKGTSLSKDHPLRAKLTVTNCPDVEIASRESTETIAGFQSHNIYRSGDSWVEPLYRLQEPFWPLVSLRVLQETAVNPSITIGAATVSYDGTLRAGEELQIGPGTDARLVPSSLVVGDLGVLSNPAGPHGAKGWSQGGEVVSLRVMNPSKPGAKIRVSISGKVAGGAVSMVRLTGYKLPDSHDGWAGQPILVNALTDRWQDDVSVQITLPDEADIRQVVLYRHGDKGTVWYGHVAVTPADMPTDGVDVSERVRGSVPIFPVMVTDAVGGQVKKPLRLTYTDASESTWTLPRVLVQVVEAAR